MTLVDVIQPDRFPDVCSDPDDNQVLAAAAWGAAKVIVTGDKDLLTLAAYQGAAIMSPSAYSQVLLKS
ncbi:MAG: putative toxin-antitoxin system toxin component, PIN family [Candidatus Dormiibacter spiritus]|nr:MAG: putative toxin-antitoxin system toxin component, PIN family [Candidatus Dormibacteraeota bacterium]